MKRTREGVDLEVRKVRGSQVMGGFKSEKEEFELTSEFNFEQVLLQ